LRAVGSNQRRIRFASARVWHAQNLLTEGNMKIRDIASACGFNSPNRFYAAFKRLVGRLPTECRASL